MFARTLSAAAFALVLSHAGAFAGEATSDLGMKTATAACAAINAYGPVDTVATVDDGVGDYLVWTKDKDGDIWLCNASAEGAVFANTMMEGDLLSGDGAALVNVQPVGNRRDLRSSNVEPAAAAQSLCAAIGNYVESMNVVAAVDDGVGDYLVWLKNDDDGLWLCNASSDGKLYDFEPVDMPINDYEPAENRFA